MDVNQIGLTTEEQNYIVTLLNTTGQLLPAAAAATPSDILVSITADYCYGLLNLSPATSPLEDSILKKLEPYLESPTTEARTRKPAI